MKIGSLFAGIGGFELGLERGIPGSQTIWQVEQDPFCRRVLQKHWPNAQLFDDVKTVGKHNLAPVDLICGGFPCQDLSVAGKGAGIHDGKRSNLWWEMYRIISELQPRFAVLENVPVLINRGLGDILGALSNIGYDAEWRIISARDQGAPHLRRRVFIVAYTAKTHSRQPPGINIPMDEKRGRLSKPECRNSKIARLQPINPTKAHGKEQPRDSKCMGSEIRSKCRNCEDHRINQRNYWEENPPPPPFCSVDDGVSNRLDRLRALGNAIVPQCAELIGRCINEKIHQETDKYR